MAPLLLTLRLVEDMTESAARLLTTAELLIVSTGVLTAIPESELSVKPELTVVVPLLVNEFAVLVVTGPPSRKSVLVPLPVEVAKING